MPDTIYGPIDDKTLEVQQGKLLELCPEYGTDVTEIDRGEKYIRNGQFFVSGNEMQIPQTMDGTGHAPPDSVWHAQGYKIHVSAHPSKAFEVAQAVVPLFKQTPEGNNPLGGVYHKVSVLDSYAKDSEELQRGKFITIYAKDETQLKQIAETLEKALITSGISGDTHGGKLSSGDTELGTSGMISMRWGQFFGEPDKQIYVNGEFTKDERSVSCPESMRQEFDRVAQETNLRMQQARVGLGLDQQQPQQSQHQISTTSTTPEVGKKKVSEVLNEEKKWSKQSKRYGGKVDTKEMEKAFALYRKRDGDGNDDGPGGPSLGGHRKKVM